MSYNTIIIITIVITIIISIVAVTIRFMPNIKENHAKGKHPHYTYTKGSRHSANATLMLAAVFTSMIAAFVFSELLYMSTLGWICVIMSVPALIGYAVSK